MDLVFWPWDKGNGVWHSGLVDGSDQEYKAQVRGEEIGGLRGEGVARK